MTIREIELKHGLPANIRIPLSVIVRETRILTGQYLYRTVTRRLENGHYMQVDNKQPHLGEFQMCYTESVSEYWHADWEYLGQPKDTEIVF